jgi:hypothetical protein
MAINVIQHDDRLGYLRPSRPKFVARDCMYLVLKVNNFFPNLEVLLKICNQNTCGEQCWTLENN